MLSGRTERLMEKAFLDDRDRGISLEEVIAFTGGRPLAARDGTVFTGVSTDSRSAEAGELFVALRGERFDGHDFLEEALARGVGGLVVDRPPRPEVLERVEASVVLVRDTLVALGDLAGGWRRKFSMPVGVLTGSNGKTTTKEMTVAVLRLCFSCLWSPGNQNNRIGLPLALLRLRSDHERVVLEMGMNEPGEIGTLTRIARPQVGALLNVGPAHLERFSSIEDVAEAKGEMLGEMPREALLVYNLGDPRVRRLARRWRGPSRSFGFGQEADVRLLEVGEQEGERRRIRLSVGGREIRTELHAPGRHNLSNALAAAALSWSLGAPVDAVAEGLARFRPLQGRFRIRRFEAFTMVDDSYNANPASMESAMETLVAMSGEADRILVLGDMLELGEASERAHLDLGRAIGRVMPTLLCVTGRWADRVIEGARQEGVPAERIVGFEEPGAAVEAVTARLRGGEWILVKGSRGMALERVVEALAREAGPEREPS